MKVKVKDIKQGDVYSNPQGSGGWTALEDAVPVNGGVQLKVEHKPEGGRGFRVWTDPDHKLEITRERST